MRNCRVERTIFRIATVVFVVLYVAAIVIEWTSGSRGMVFALIFNALVLFAAIRAPFFRDYASYVVSQEESAAEQRAAALERRSERGACALYVVLLGAAYALVVITTMGATAGLVLFAAVALTLFTCTIILAVTLFRRPSSSP